MSLRQLAVALRRRLALMVPGLLLVVAGAVVVGVVTPAQYEARGSVLLLSPPRSPDVPEGINPFLNFGATLGVTADVLRLSVTDPPSVEGVQAQGGTDEFTVATDTSGSGPILLVTAEDDSPQVAASTVDAVVAAMTAQLATRQEAAGAPAPTWITLARLDDRSVPERNVALPVRLAFVVGAVGVLALLSGILLFDRWLVGRSVRPPQRRTGSGGDNRPDLEKTEPDAKCKKPDGWSSPPERRVPVSLATQRRRQREASRDPSPATDTPVR